jgi:hypothetical protein
MTKSPKDRNRPTLAKMGVFSRSALSAAFCKTEEEKKVFFGIKPELPK